ncbi:MAG TPA: M20/M25/M40 family metallo-hydrolase [Blastocatellia bacterium]|nr:M20/M25/M40 family metallo-hydrolase [Blastocatellia bacterium]
MIKVRDFSLTILIVFCLTFTSSFSSQRRVQIAGYEYPPQLLDELKRLRQAALTSDYALKQTAYLTNNIGPRLSGSPQAQRAVEYVAEEMRKLGLEVQLEKLKVPHWVRGVETGELTQFPGMAPGTRQKIVLTALGGSVATPPEGLTAPVVVVNDFNELTALGESRVKGKIVLFNVKFDEQMQAQGFGGQAYSQSVIYRGLGASNAARLGAIAALNRSAGSGAWRLAHTGALRYQEGVAKIPAAAVSSEDADLIATLSNQSEVVMKLTLTPQTLPDADSYNVIADLKGSESPDQIVIVSGHLDSWDLGTGALDDAAGVAVAMQVANLCRQLQLKPRRTIRFIAWMNEENGLAGGRTYFQNQANNIANHIAAIESDLGSGHPAGFDAHIPPSALPMLQPLAGILQSFGAGMIRPVTDSVGADISPLENAGVPGFSPTQDERSYFIYHHTVADTFDKINPRELAENAAVMSVLGYAIASLPAPLPKQTATN